MNIYKHDIVMISIKKQLQSLQKILSCLIAATTFSGPKTTWSTLSPGSASSRMPWDGIKEQVDSYAPLMSPTYNTESKNGMSCSTRSGAKMRVPLVTVTRYHCMHHNQTCPEGSRGADSQHYWQVVEVLSEEEILNWAQNRSQIKERRNLPDREVSA